MTEAMREATKRTKARNTRVFVFRGNNARLAGLTDQSEVVLAGAAGTGKTLAALAYLNKCMWDYPGSRGLIVRKVRADLAESVLVTFEQDVLGEDNPICAGAQRENRHSYKYPNSSQIVLGGMDRPGRVLSAQYDLIYVPECVQMELNDWETLVMRNRNYVMPYQQVFGDTNPDRPDHWLKQREAAGKVLILPTTHKDNPAYWDEAAQDWTARGRDYVLGKLATLSGVRADRYLRGLWVQAEGAIYEFSDATHLVERENLPEFVWRFRAVDFGYTHPFVCQWWGVDADGRMYLYREIYRTGRLVEDHAADILRLTGDEPIEWTIADHDAEDRATLARHGIITRPANKAVLTGIQLVQERLRVQGDGKPRLFVVRGALVERDQELRGAGKPSSTQEEFGSYVWNDKSAKEAPVKEHDHGMDALRYAVMAAEAGGNVARKIDIRMFG